jgi:hypothetical protein
MDGKMKGMIMAGMMALSLVLGAMAIFSNSWLTEEDEDNADVTRNTGLSTYQIVAVGYDSADECDATAKMAENTYEDADAEAECDGKELTMNAVLSKWCELADDMGADSDEVDDCEAAASAGTMGQIGMWGGVVFALLATLMLVLPMAGVDAMDAIPEMGQKVISWGAGGLMLLGMVLWYFMLPDGDSSMGTGLWIAGAAMSIALGSTLIGQFIPSDE